MPKKYSLRRYKPKGRKLRITKTINSKSLLIFFSFVAFSFFSVFVFKNTSKINLSKSAFFSNVIQSVSISVKDSKIEKELNEIISRYKTSVFSKDIKEEIISGIKAKFPYLTQIELKFNPVTGNLKLEAEIKKSIGVIEQEDSKLYLLEDGRYSDVSYNEDDNLLRISANPQKNLSEFQAETIKKLYLNKEKFGFDFKIKIEGDNLYLLSDDYQILWGSFFYFDEKLEKIKYVLKDAKSKINEPLNIDLRFFEEGKILVSPKKTNLLK
ncbi:MAG TPA: hypothetical protein PK103_01320 [Elusimicrobiales bacterium]|nr:hypothetical protein [Elusimicrobiales bacterium]HOL61985.1 hypothetical protein [Elusimicrobiales bacterium]HPO94513.1 hypothetical protein [Elusimicrobiales bacterium]